MLHLRERQDFEPSNEHRRFVGVDDRQVQERPVQARQRRTRARQDRLFSGLGELADTAADARSNARGSFDRCERRDEGRGLAVLCGISGVATYFREVREGV